jgi:hypothetical protein
MGAAMIAAATPEPEREHPIIARFAVAAIIVASLLIAWARFEVHGTADLEAALTEESGAEPSPKGDAALRSAQVDDAVTASRWASTFSP